MVIAFSVTMHNFSKSRAKTADAFLKLCLLTIKTVRSARIYLKIICPANNFLTINQSHPSVRFSLFVMKLFSIILFFYGKKITRSYLLITHPLWEGQNSSHYFEVGQITFNLVIIFFLAIF